MSNKVFFLDRDGVVNIDSHYTYKSSEFIFRDGIFTLCKTLENQGFKIIIVTNQSGIGRGYFTESDFKKLTLWMLEEFKKHKIKILDIFHCPHSPDSKCACRKPKPGLIHKACSKFKIEIDKSWLIGDKESDIKAAEAAGILNTILLGSNEDHNDSISNAKYVLKSLHECNELILSK